jgi:hypothetical protein
MKLDIKIIPLEESTQASGMGWALTITNIIVQYKYCVSGHYSLSCFYLNATFWRLDYVSIFMWNLLSLAQSIELVPIAETLCLNKNRTMDNVQNTQYLYHDTIVKLLDLIVMQAFEIGWALEQLSFKAWNFERLLDEQAMLGVSLIITAWHVLGLRMEETPSNFGGKPRIYCISNRGPPARGGPPAWRLGVGLTTLHRKK